MLRTIGLIIGSIIGSLANRVKDKKKKICKISLTSCASIINSKEIFDDSKMLSIPFRIKQDLTRGEKEGCRINFLGSLIGEDILYPVSRAGS